MTARATMSGTTEAASAPCCDTCATMRSIPCSSMISSASGATPCFRAKPSAALVHWPLSSFAADSGGPTTVLFRSGPFVTSPCTSTASRRGVEKSATESKDNPCPVRPSVMLWRSARTMPVISPAGSSSVPSSNSKSAVLTLHLPALLPAAGVPPRQDRGRLAGIRVHRAQQRRLPRRLSRVCARARCSVDAQ